MSLVASIFVLLTAFIFVSANELCDNSTWNIIKGNWSYDATNCSLTVGIASGNAIWFGSADGNTPDTDYEHDTFALTVALAINSGHQAGIVFRASHISATNNAGPTYIAQYVTQSVHAHFGAFTHQYCQNACASNQNVHGLIVFKDIISGFMRILICCSSER